MKKLLYLLTFLIPVFVKAQVTRAYSMRIPPSGPTINTSGNIGNLSTSVGSPSSSGHFTFTATGLTGNITWTQGTGTQVSSDNVNFFDSVVFVPSSGIASGTVYVRIPSTQGPGSYSGNVVGTSPGATPVSVPYSASVTSGASMSTSTNTITNLNSNSGTAGPSQNFRVTFANLPGNVSVTNFSPVELSVDNINFSSSLSFNGGSPVTVYVRESAGAPVGSVSGNLTVSAPGSGLSNILVAVTGTVSSIPQAIFNFSSTSSTVAGATNFFGDPTTSPSVTDPTTTWTLAAVGANWTKYGGSFYGGVGNGATQASTDGTFTQAQINSNLYSTQTWNASTKNYGLQFTNLPAGTYTITLLGSIPTSVFANGGCMAFHVQFGTGSDNVSGFDPNGTGSTGNLTSSGPGTTNVTTGSFTGTITSGQTINIAVSSGYACGSGTGTLGYINAIKIVKTN